MPFFYFHKLIINLCEVLFFLILVKYTKKSFFLKNQFMKLFIETSIYIYKKNNFYEINK